MLPEIVNEQPSGWSAMSAKPSIYERSASVSVRENMTANSREERGVLREKVANMEKIVDIRNGQCCEMCLYDSCF